MHQVVKKSLLPLLISGCISVLNLQLLRLLWGWTDRWKLDLGYFYFVVTLYTYVGLSLLSAFITYICLSKTKFKNISFLTGVLVIGWMVAIFWLIPLIGVFIF